MVSHNRITECIWCLKLEQCSIKHSFCQFCLFSHLNHLLGLPPEEESITPVIQQGLGNS